MGGVIVACVKLEQYFEVGGDFQDLESGGYETGEWRVRESLKIQLCGCVELSGFAGGFSPLLLLLLVFDALGCVMRYFGDSG